MTDPHACLHEEQIQSHSKTLVELEARADFKDQRISELIEDNKRIERKIDKLTETVNKGVLNSVQDDNDLRQEVANLKTKLETQEKDFNRYREEDRKKREEERAKQNQRLTFITVGLAVLTFVLTHIFK